MKLKASTIVEAIISALIILISFGLTLTILVQVGAKKEGADYYDAQLAIDSLQQEIKIAKNVSKKAIIYPWGYLSVEKVEPKENGCLLITIQAKSVKGTMLNSRSIIVDSTFSSHAP